MSSIFIQGSRVRDIGLGGFRFGVLEGFQDVWGCQRLQVDGLGYTYVQRDVVLKFAGFSIDASGRVPPKPYALNPKP